MHNCSRSELKFEGGEFAALDLLSQPLRLCQRSDDDRAVYCAEVLNLDGRCVELLDLANGGGWHGIDNGDEV